MSSFFQYKEVTLLSVPGSDAIRNGAEQTAEGQVSLSICVFI